MIRLVISIAFATFISLSVFGQETNNPEVVIKGKVYNELGNSVFSNLFVVNKRTRKGNFANPSGDFEIRALKNDTILIGSSGYTTYRLTVKDSAVKELYVIRVQLTKLQIQLEEVSIFAERDLDQIYADIRELGYDPKDFKEVTGVNAFASPITALYASLSRHEQQKLRAYELMNEDRRRDLLKELFKKYVSADIIDLQEKQFDDFIDFCNVSDEFMQNSTQYEFIEYIKMKYRLFEEITKFDDYYRGE